MDQLKNNKDTNSYNNQSIARRGLITTPMSGREQLYKDENVILEHNAISDHYSLRNSKTGMFMEKGGEIEVADVLKSHSYLKSELNNIQGIVEFVVIERNIEGLPGTQDKYMIEIHQDGKKLADFGTTPVKVSPEFVVYIVKKNLHYGLGGEVSKDDSFKYMMLSRYLMDADYFLGAGGGYEGHLYHKSVPNHISAMKELWNSFPEDGKPEWLTMEQINDYETKMNHKLESETPKLQDGGETRKRRDAYNWVYDRLLKVAPDLLNQLEKAEYPSDVYGKSQYRTEDFGGDDPYMYLSIEGLDKDDQGRYILSISHYYKQQGDMMCDPCMTVRLDPKQKTVEALSFKMDGAIGRGIVKEVYGLTSEGNPGVNLREKKSQNSFLNIWSNNWVKQKHEVTFSEEEEIENILSDEDLTNYIETNITAFDEDGNPTSFTELFNKMMLDSVIKVATNPDTLPHAKYMAIKRINNTGSFDPLSLPSKEEVVKSVEAYLDRMSKVKNILKKESEVKETKKVELSKDIAELIKFLNTEKDPRRRAAQWNGDAENEKMAYRSRSLPHLGHTLWQVALVDPTIEIKNSGREDKIWFSGDDLLRAIKRSYRNEGLELIIPDVNVEEDKAFKGLDFDYKNQFYLNKAIEYFLDTKDNNYIFSDEEKQFIYKYEGYGGLEKLGAKGKGLLHEYYTPDELIQKMWGLAYKYGFQTGKVLEPSVGIGRMFDYSSPQDKLFGYEINPYSARICKIIHPKSIINLESFEEHFYNGNVYNPKFEKDYDLVIGNPPYGKNVGKRSIAELKRLKVGSAQFEHYFILRGLDVLKSGGLLIYVSTANLYTKGYEKVKERIAEKADLVDFYLLPSTTFKRTKVNTSLIVLKRK